jgi:hypothetical protein
VDVDLETQAPLGGRTASLWSTLLLPLLQYKPGAEEAGVLTPAAQRKRLRQVFLLLEVLASRVP